MNRPLALAIVTLAQFVTPSVSACSLVGCIDRGVEFNRSFVLVFKHEGKPQRGVRITVTDNVPLPRYSGLTDSNGTARVEGLPPGDYWLSAELLGINGAYHCFHVNVEASRKAKRTSKYEWGEYPLSVQRVAGMFVDSQPGQGETPLWNLVHRVKVPIAGASIRLQSPSSETMFSATSDRNGAFSIDRVPAGSYVLHFEGGSTGRGYDPTDFLVRVEPRSSRETLEFVRSEGGAGSCGGHKLELSTQARN